MFHTKAAENIKTHFIFDNDFPENRVVNEIMWKIILEPDRLQMTTWSMCIACLITKATHAHTHTNTHTFRT